MILPDYKRGSIVNLMSCIMHAYGSRSKYAQLDKKLTMDIKRAKNVVLLIVDGLGADSFDKLEKTSFLKQHFLRNMTTVFPSTTASAITTFYTGLAPQEHGVMGWYMYMEEVGGVVLILRTCTRQGQPIEVDAKVLSLPPPIFNKMNADSHIVIKDELCKSDYNRHFAGKSRFWGYSSLRGMYMQIRKAVNCNDRRKYIHAYWPEFDSFSHYFGKEDKLSIAHMREIDDAMQHLALMLGGTDTLLLLTADHGQVTTSARRSIILNRRRMFKNCLTLPVCGEPRAAFCYVHPHKVKQFESYVRTNLKKYCTLHKTEELIRKHYFGLGKEHPRLHDRLGDYILLLKGNYAFFDFLADEEEGFLKGNHGGLSEEEMMVPLVKVKIK